MLRWIPTLCLLGLCLPTTALADELDQTSFRDDALGVRLTGPDGWIVTRQTGYPSMLALLLPPPSDASITLSVGTPRPTDSLETFAARNAEAMRAIGLNAESKGKSQSYGLTAVEVRAQKGDESVRQLYIEHRDRVLILTLICPERLQRKYLSELQLIVELLQLTPPETHREENAS